MMIFHDDVYEPRMNHTPTDNAKPHSERGPRIQYGWQCRHCPGEAPCSWQIKHDKDCPHRHREGKLLEPRAAA